MLVEHTRCFDPAFVAVRDRVREGYIGDLTRIVAYLGGKRAMLFRNSTHLLGSVIFFAESSPKWVIAALDHERELSRITEPVSPDLEIGAVTDRVSKSPGGGPALLFERPTGFDIPVAVNLFGSMKRICMALNVSRLDDLATEIEELTTPKIPAGMLDALKMLPTVNRLRDLTSDEIDERYEMFRLMSQFEVLP